MIVRFSSGSTELMPVGSPTMGKRIDAVTVTMHDVADPRFLEWFTTSVLTRFPNVVTESPCPGRKPGT